MSDDAPDSVIQHHDKIVPEILKLIIEGTYDAGGTPQHVMTIIESIVAGTMLSVFRVQHLPENIDSFIKNLRERIKEMREQNADAIARAEAEALAAERRLQ